MTHFKIVLQYFPKLRISSCPSCFHLPRYTWLTKWKWIKSFINSNHVDVWRNSKQCLITPMSSMRTIIMTKHLQIMFMVCIFFFVPVILILFTFSLAPALQIRSVMCNIWVNNRISYTTNQTVCPQQCKWQQLPFTFL